MRRNLNREPPSQTVSPLLHALRVQGEGLRRQAVLRILSGLDKDQTIDELLRIDSADAVEVLGMIVIDDSDPEIQRKVIQGLRRIEKKAERERALEETRAFIAHEFRHALTPLNAYVKMLDEALHESEIDKDRLNSLTVRIRKQTDAAFDLVEQYLDYSRPLAPHFVRVNINELLQQSLDEYKTELARRNIDATTRFVDHAKAEVDRGMLAQVLHNIIANAIQAIGQEGALILATTVTEHNVEITIRDTGTGIKPEHLKRIFEVGYTTKSSVRGAGVGLPLSRRIIEDAHNGTITIWNNTDGPGAAVLITLPSKQMEKTNGRLASALADRRRR